jgi:lipid-A-disaccharide synthase
MIDGRAAEAVGASDAAIVCSGTAALEAGLMLRPFVVVYRVALLSGLIFKLFAKVAHVSLVNLLAGRTLVPELLQYDCTPAKVSAAVLRLLDEPAARESMVAGLAEVRSALGSPGASAQAAEAVVSLVRRLEASPPGARTVAATTTH